MRRVVLALLLSTPALANTPAPPILGGTPTTVGQFPAVVVIEVGQGLCTGTLITKDWVLTAAHCVTPGVVGTPDQASLTQSVRVHFNTVTISTPGTIIGAQDTIPDPMFNVQNLGQFDSGLIHLKTPAPDSIPPVLLNWVAAKAPIGIGVTMVGFGATGQGGTGTVGTEYTVAQTSIACSTLSAGGPALSDANLLCFNQISGKGKCEGDSGGPSFAMIDGKTYEVGVTSFGDQNCSMFGADTRVDAEKPFILKHVPDVECQSDTDCPMMKECFLHRCIAQPFGPGGLGTACMANTDCDSGTCAAGEGGMKCTMTCTVGMAGTCPMGLECEASSSGAMTGACWPPQGGGCCDASGKGAPTALAMAGLCGLVLRRRRRP